MHDAVKPALAAALAFSFAVAAGAAAAEAPRKGEYVPVPNDPTVGVLGQRKDAPAGSNSKEWRKAAPPAPVAAMPQPKVEAEAPVMPAGPQNYGGNLAAPLPAAPRPQAGIEGQPQAVPGQPSLATPIPQIAPPPSGFLSQHPFASGVVAGLVGTELGAIAYGGPMQGDSDGVVVGYALRIGVILLAAFLLLRMAWRMMGGGRGEPDYYGTAGHGRREPSFGRGSDSHPSGRREPTFGRD